MIPLDYILSRYAVGNYDATWESYKEKLTFCDNLWGQAFNDDAKNLNNFLVQYVGTSGTGINTVSCYTRSNIVCKCYIDIKRYFKIDAYEETKLQSTFLFYKVHIMMETGNLHSSMIKTWFRNNFYSYRKKVLSPRWQFIWKCTKGTYSYQLLNRIKKGMEQATGQPTDFW